MRAVASVLVDCAPKDRMRAEANQRADGLRIVFEGLSGLSARKAAEELNSMDVPTPNSGKWHATTVIQDP